MTVHLYDRNRSPLSGSTRVNIDGSGAGGSSLALAHVAMPLANPILFSFAAVLAFVFVL